MAAIVFTGDSHTDGTGAPPGRSWPAQMMPMLGRTDLRMTNLAKAGETLAQQVEAWEDAVAPLLGRSGEVRIVFAMGGYNDISVLGATADAIVATYRRQGALARAAGARFVAGLDVIRFDGDGASNRVVRAVNAMLRRDWRGMADAAVDFAAADPLFDRPDGPWDQPPFAPDRVHLDGEGQRRMAAIAAPVFRSLLDGA